MEHPYLIHQTETFKIFKEYEYVVLQCVLCEHVVLHDVLCKNEYKLSFNI